MRVATHQLSHFESHRNSGLSANSSKPRWSRQMLAFLLAIGMLFATLPQNVLAAQDNQDQTAQDQPQDQAPAVGDATPAYTPQSPDQVDQLVAPIALYPDSLVAQILSAATFPAQIVEADRWVQAHPDLKDDCVGASCRSAELGSQRESALRISFRAGEYGQKYFLDFVSRRRLLQSAARCDGRDSAHASKSASSRAI